MENPLRMVGRNSGIQRAATKITSYGSVLASAE